MPLVATASPFGFSPTQLSSIQLSPAGLTALVVAVVVLAGAAGFVLGRVAAAERIAGLREQLARARATVGTDDAVLGQFRAVS